MPQVAVLLVAAWAILVPFVADDLGVTTRQEVVDHVIPGAVALAGAALSGARWTAAAMLVFLAGLFVTAAHVPLLVADVPAAAAAAHLSAGLPLLAVGVWMLLRPPPRRPPRA